MNPKDRNKYILFAVLVLGAIGMFAYQITRPPVLPEMPDRPDRPATQRTQPTAAPAGPVGSAFVQTDVDIDQLLASVQEVDFNYDLERLTRNPMTPLVGSGATTTAFVEAPARGDMSPALTVARAMVITAIVYDETDPMAVLENKTDQQVEVVTIGHEFPIGILVESIEESRVVLRVGDMRIPKLLEEQ
jgi:hypothetical protein